MRRLPPLILLVLAVISLLPAATPAQKKRAKAQGTRGLDTVRQQFESGEADGLSFTVYKYVRNQPVAVDPSHTFRQGDEIKLDFESNFDGYIYIVNVMPNGARRLLFPYQGQGDNMVRKRRTYSLPKPGLAWKFDEQKGTEILQVIMSRQRIPFLDAAIGNPKGNLDESAAGAAAELARNQKSPRAGIVSDEIALALPPRQAGTMNSRGIKLGRGREKGTTIAIPKDKGKGSQLQTGEVSIFEIRLRHI